MKHNYIASFIIPVRISNQGRLENLYQILDWLADLKDEIEVIVVEMDTHAKFEPERATKHVFVESNDAFNRGLARNIGALHASTDILVFGDADVVFNHAQLLQAIESCLDRFDAVSPWSRIYDVSHSEKEKLIGHFGDISTLYKSDVEQTSKTMISECVDFLNQERSFAGGNVIFTRDSFVRIGGWPMDLTGWGGEDDIMSYLCFRTLTINRQDGSAYHLPHKRDVTDTNAHSSYKSNFKKMEDVFNMSDAELHDYMLNNRVMLFETESGFSESVRSNYFDVDKNIALKDNQHRWN